MSSAYSRVATLFYLELINHLKQRIHSFPYSMDITLATSEKQQADIRIVEVNNKKNARSRRKSRNQELKTINQNKQLIITCYVDSNRVRRVRCH